MNKPKRPRDANQLAKHIVDLSTGDAREQDKYAGKNPAAVELGCLGGLKGGKVRAEKLTPEQRSEIARITVSARWKKLKIKQQIPVLLNAVILQRHK